MRINTITCHDVYNFGASLQAYALMKYLTDCGHDVQIIDYKPDYLSRHYSLTWVPNPRYQKPFLRQAYLLAKFPERIMARKGLRKHRFDTFRKEFLNLTPHRYTSIHDLINNCPLSDVYIAGSDQIWNPLFPNGKDPAFFLTFVPDEKKKISYAASFSVDTLSEEDRNRMSPWLSRLDVISVRETSGLNLLNSMGINGIQVMDPVFLLHRDVWESIAISPHCSGYILVYDFDNSQTIQQIATKLAYVTNKTIISAFPMNGASEVWPNMGPREFLGALANADFIISNSFHATAFSLIFQKQFYVVNRQDKINSRMQDLLSSLDLENRLISSANQASSSPISWEEIASKLEQKIQDSMAYIHQNLC